MKDMDIVDWLRAEAELVALHRLKEAADEIERLRFALRTVLGDADHGQKETWEERIRIGREALGSHND